MVVPLTCAGVLQCCFKLEELQRVFSSDRKAMASKFSPSISLGLQVFQLAAHLVYWGKAVIIYPLCENNVYVLSPNASVCL